MTLPAGQISLSEVNVELGYSATALISLNDSAVRSLAGVASGQIAMSNLQGKSAVSYWVLTTPASSPTANPPFGSEGMAVSSNGTCCLTLNSSYAGGNGRITYVYQDGSMSTNRSTITAPYSTVLPCVNNADNSTPTNPKFAFTVGQGMYTPYGFRGGFTPNTASTWTEWKIFSVSGSSAYPYVAANNFVFDSSGNSYGVGMMQWTSGKSIRTGFWMAKWNSSGTFQWAFSSTGNNLEPPCMNEASYSTQYASAIRSDGLVVVAFCPYQLGLYVFNASGTGQAPSGTSYLYQFPQPVSYDVATTLIALDANNNVFVCKRRTASGYTQPFITRYSSATTNPTMTHAAWFQPGGSGNWNGNGYTGASGFTVYGNYVYFLCQTTGSYGNNGYFTVTALNIADLTVAYTLLFTLLVDSDPANTVNLFLGPGDPYGRTALSVNANGIFITGSAKRISTNLQYGWVMKIPLDGVISGTKTVNFGGVNGSLTITKVTSGVNNTIRTTNSVYSPTETPFSKVNTKLSEASSGVGSFSNTTQLTSNKSVVA